MKKNYDYIIVGGGPAGSFFAYEMINKKPDAKILLIEQGKRVEERHCPEKQCGKCIKCQPHCNITCGFSGAGAFSDGKLSLYNPEDDDFYVGGNLHKYIGVDETKKLIDYTDSIYLKFGATSELKGIAHKDKIARIRKKSEIHGLTLINIPIRHLGTDKAHKLFSTFENYLENAGITMLFNTSVTDILTHDNKILGIVLNNDEAIYTDHLVLAVGRVGANWLFKQCEKNNIRTVPGTIDIGVRYELPDEIMYEINNYLYEGKFIGKPSPFNDKVRTFCQNPSGFVTTEVYDNEITLVNGHSCKESKSPNTNLALLVSLNIPNVNPLKYTRYIAKNINDLANNSVLIQRLGDLKYGKKTWPEDISSNNVVPTLKSAIPGDLTMAMPYRMMTDIIEFIQNLDNVISGFANDDNLLYGPEIKFYSNKVELSKNFETSVSGLYAIGDGCGLTRGLMMASASGVQLARVLSNN